MKKEKLIYFMRRSDGRGPIKIGCTINVESRLQAMSLWSPYPLEVLASVVGVHRDENLLHWKFRAERLHGEWFKPTAALLDLVARVKERGELPEFIGDEDRHNKIISLFFAGETQAKIADRFNVTRQRVQQILSDNGIYARARDAA